MSVKPILVKDKQIRIYRQYNMTKCREEFVAVVGGKIHYMNLYMYSKMMAMGYSKFIRRKDK